jgi:hypothetical protein
MRWDYAHRQAAQFLAACFLVGSILGALVELAKGGRS